MQMKYADFLKFINAGLAKWERIKKDFSSDKEMSAFLKKAYRIGDVRDLLPDKSLREESGFSEFQSEVRHFQCRKDDHAF